MRGWDTVFYALVALSALSLTVADGPPEADLATMSALAALVVLVLSYVLVGRRGAMRGDVRLTRAYLVVLIAVVTLVSGINSLGSVLLFVGFAQIWFLATRLAEGVVASVLLAVSVCTAMVLQYEPSGADVLRLAGQMAIGLLFSLALGLWITRVAEQSEERADLLERLEAAQSELVTSNHAAGVLAERERVAQEIHDTLAQGFTSVVMLAQTAAAQIERGQDGAALDRVAQIEAVARENLAEARALVAAFGPAALAGSTLEEALARLAARFEAETGVVVEVVLGRAGRRGRDTEVVLLRAAQEALANVRKHAGAQHVVLRLTERSDGIELDVRDDGRGIDPGAVDGVGLRGMRERVRAGGGSLDVSGAPDGGTRLRLRLPTGGGDGRTTTIDEETA